MLTSKTYTVAWDEMLYNALDVESQLKVSGDAYLVWDVCTEPSSRDSWVPAEKVRYYGHFYNSLVDFATTDHDIFIFNAGDAISDDHPGFIKRIASMMEADSDVWMMAPRMVNDGGDGMTTLIQMSKKYEDIGLIAHINGIYVSLKRELALVILNYFKWLLEKGFMNFSTMITGHCLDTVYAAWTIYNKKKIYRDWVFAMETTKTTSYKTGTALKECNTVKDKFRQYVQSIGGNPTLLQTIYNAISETESTYAKTEVPLLKVYPHLSDEWELDY